MKGGGVVAKYLVRRILHGILSIIAVVAVVMILVYALGDRQLIFMADPLYTKQNNNNRIAYTYRMWKEYGYLDYVPFGDYLNSLVKAGELDADTRADVARLGRTQDKDSEQTAKYAADFRAYYESLGYTVERVDAKMATPRKVADGGNPLLFAYKDRPLLLRVVEFFTGIFSVDNIHYVEENYPDAQLQGEAGLTFTWYDPAYGGEKFSPAIIGNGTRHKYLMYCTDSFPFVHQNMFTIRLGKSYVVNKGIDVFDTMTLSQGPYVRSTVYYPTGMVEYSADDLHTATYAAGSREGNALLADRYTDDYTNVFTTNSDMSKMGFSFTIGIIAVAMAYCLGLPLGLLMARRKDTWVDKLGTIYIVFIIAVPSLAYIFLFKAIGGSLGLPTSFEMGTGAKLMYVLPIVSLALPSVANLMKWMRRYMIDQMNSDYVKFARSEGLSEGEIFTKHIWKNAVIPIVHGIPGGVLGALTGAVITERVYVVPGAGNLLTIAINRYDNSVIVGMTLFYAVLSVTSLILGDILMSMVDPRISFSAKAR